MNRVQFLLDKEAQIRELLSAAWKQEVSISIFHDSADGIGDSDFEIMLDLDKPCPVVLVVITESGLRLPDPCSDEESFGFLMSVTERLEALLGCYTNYCDMKALKSFHTLTYRKRFRNT